MTIVNYSKVILLTDAFRHEGVSAGAMGYVIEVYPNNKYEVEFSDGSGITVAQIVVSGHEIAVTN